jgi:hypothetical protein
MITDKAFRFSSLPSGIGAPQLRESGQPRKVCSFGSDDDSDGQSR